LPRKFDAGDPLVLTIKRDMSNTEFNHNYLKTFILWLNDKTISEKEHIMTQIAFELALCSAPAPSPSPAPEEPAIVPATGPKLNDYQKFMKNPKLQNLLKEKYPSYSPQQIVTEKARLWQIKKKNLSLTEEQLVEFVDGTPPRAPAPLTPVPVENAIVVKTMQIRRPKRKIPIQVRRHVWNTHIGQDFTRWKCVCCDVTTIDRDNYECGHIVAETNGGDETISNLRPICGGCNRSMGTTNMRDFARKHFGRELEF